MRVTPFFFLVFFQGEDIRIDTRLGQDYSHGIGDLQGGFSDHHTKAVESTIKEVEE
jgi:hypothetical protein